MGIGRVNGIGSWKFGMTKGQVIDLFKEDSSVENQKITSKNYVFQFDDEGGLQKITLRGKAQESIEGVSIGTSLKSASGVFGCSPIFSRDDWAITFSSMPNVLFDLGQAKMEMLYEVGAAEDGELDDVSHETKKLKIKSVTAFRAS